MSQPQVPGWPQLGAFACPALVDAEGTPRLDVATERNTEQGPRMIDQAAAAEQVELWDRFIEAEQRGDFTEVKKLFKLGMNLRLLSC